MSCTLSCADTAMETETSIGDKPVLSVEQPENQSNPKPVSSSDLQREIETAIKDEPVLSVEQAENQSNPKPVSSSDLQREIETVIKDEPVHFEGQPENQRLDTSFTCKNIVGKKEHEFADQEPQLCIPNAVKQVHSASTCTYIYVSKRSGALEHNSCSGHKETLIIRDSGDVVWYFCDICGCYQTLYGSLQCHKRICHKSPIIPAVSLVEKTISMLLNAKLNLSKSINFEPLAILEIFNGHVELSGFVKDGSTDSSISTKRVVSFETKIDGFSRARNIKIKNKSQNHAFKAFETDIELFKHVVPSNTKDVESVCNLTTPSSCTESVKIEASRDEVDGQQKNYVAVNECADDHRFNRFVDSVNGSTITDSSTDVVKIETNTDDVPIADDIHIKEEFPNRAIFSNSSSLEPLADLHALNEHSEGVYNKNSKEYIDFMTGYASCAITDVTIQQLIIEEHNYCLRVIPITVIPQ